MTRRLTSSDGDPTSVDRRTFLRNCALTIGSSVPLAGCPFRRDEEPVETDSEERRTAPPVGTATDDPGEEDTTPTAWEEYSVTQVDAAPGDEVSEIFQAIEPNELLVFPPGRFSWSNETVVTVDGWGLWCQPDTVFEVPPGIGDGEEADMISTERRQDIADDFLLKNVTFDSTDRAAPGVSLAVRNQATVDGLEYAMNGPTSRGRHENGIRAYVRNSEGTLTIRDYRQFNNGNIGSFGGGDGRVGIWVGPEHEGTVHLQNPVLQGFPNNACYVSHHQGTVIVEGGLLMNNNVSAVRVSGGVEVRDTTIFIDVDRYRDGAGVVDGNAHNTRGLWGDNPEAGSPGGTATGVSFILNSYDRCTGLATMLENPIMTLQDCQFLLNEDIVAIRADGGEIVVENCTFDGEADGATAGVDSISGSNNVVAPNIEPGDVPIHSRTGFSFEWDRTHTSTPMTRGRPTPVE